MLATVPRNATIPRPTYLQRSGSTYNSMQKITHCVVEVALTAEQKVTGLYQEYVLVGCDVAYFGRHVSTFLSTLPLYIKVHDVRSKKDSNFCTHLSQNLKSHRTLVILD
jgi:hypothetical protein